MTSEYCQHCGARLSEDNRFCPQCGQPVSDRPAGSTSAAPPLSYSEPPPVPIPSKRRVAVVPILLGILLLLLAVRIPVILVAGQRTMAEVQSVIPYGSTQDYRYTVKYAFTTSGGQQVSGSYHTGKVYNVSQLPATGTSLSVKYLPGLTFLNLPDDENNLGWTTILFAVLGIGLIVLSVKGLISVSVRR